jgi:hypothetical protein
LFYLYQRNIKISFYKINSIEEIFNLIKLSNYVIIDKLKFVTSNQDMVLISSSPTQADAKSTLFNLGDNLTRTAELHVKLRLQQRNKSKDLLFERVDAIRSNDELILQLNSNQAVQIKDYFTACVVGDCLVEILQDNNTDDESSYFSLPADSVGLELSNDTQLMLALGGDTDLLQI